MDRRKRDSVNDGMGELNRQIERLQRDLGRRERELEEERRETERIMDRMRILEKDKIDLKRELDEVRDEVTEYQRLVDEIQQDQAKSKGQPKGENEEARLNNLRATLQDRNREIGQFIQDLEKMNEEKDVLKSRLKEASGSLQEATKQLSEMTKDRIDLKTKLGKTEEVVHRLEEEKAVVEIRERDLLAFKERHDQHLENLGNVVDIRVDVWKNMMFEKDEEIESLNAKVEALMKQVPTPQMEAEKDMINHLNMKVKERENHIHLLTHQLQVATEELNYNTNVIQTLQAQGPHSGSGEETERVLRAYEKKVRKLESKVEKRGLALGTVEKEAEEKTKEIVHLTARLRDYEAGQYGLSDAITEIKDLKGQLRIRDRDLDKLTQEVNQCQMEGSELMEENEMLRKKLGHSPYEDLSKDRRHFIKKRDEELINLKTEMEVMEDEITVLKTKNYELKKLLTAAEERQHSHQTDPYPQPHETIHYPLEPSHHPQDHYSRPHRIEAPLNYSRDSLDEHWREKYDIILHENTELRKGLQEILDSFQRLGEDGGCNVRVESPILENLLREMSARGLINYPYSISSFHLKVCNLEGKNSQLREELHRTRLWAEGLLDKEKQRCDEWREKALAAQEMVKHNHADDSEKQDEFTQRLKESQLETGRWRRIGEQSEKLIAMLNEKLDESETKILNLETRLENIARESQKIQRTSSLEKIPLPVLIDTRSIGVQTEKEESIEKESIPELTVDLEPRLRELENLLAAKDEVIENLQTAIPTYEFKSVRSNTQISDSEIQEGLQLARETIQSLTQRLRTKDDNLTAYKKLLAEVRGEMQTATERHVQDMNVLQSTIHQQQQAFTRMKSTLSHPVKDSQTSDIDGIIREQLTRINELEECVRDMEHTMGNVASQLAAARGDVHRWRTTADTRLKEIDNMREQVQTENPEVEILRERIRIQDEKIGEMKRLGQTVSVLKEMLEEKEIEVQSLKTSVGTLPVQSQAHRLQTSVAEKPSEEIKSDVQRLRKTNQELQSKVSKLQLRLSKMNATNRASGMSGEMEELRRQYDVTVEQRDALREQIHHLELHAQEDDEKKRKTVDGFARWEEGKKWKKIVERLDEQKRENEEQRGKLNKQVESLRGLVARLEKDKVLLDSRLKKSVKMSVSDQSLCDDRTIVGKLREEIEDVRELLDQKEFTAKEEIERLTMESRILRDRIQTQERQLTAYQVSHKGDDKVITEIEKLIQNGDRLQQDLIKMEQENLDLKLQLQELKLETPRLRDRVQHLLKLVDILKAEKSEGQRGKPGRSLGELERTISALKSIIDKIHKEKRSISQPKGSKSNMSLRERQECLIEEKQLLMDQIHELEEYKCEAQKVQGELERRIDGLTKERDDAQSRMKSAEMKLKTFLDEEGGQSSSSRDRFKALEDELERKSNLLTEAKRALEEITQAKKSSLKRN